MTMIQRLQKGGMSNAPIDIKEGCSNLLELLEYWICENQTDRVNEIRERHHVNLKLINYDFLVSPLNNEIFHNDIGRDMYDITEESERYIESETYSIQKLIDEEKLGLDYTLNDEIEWRKEEFNDMVFSIKHFDKFEYMELFSVEWFYIPNHFHPDFCIKVGF